MEIPGKIAELIGKKFGKQENIGLSGASVYIYDSMVLKVQNWNTAAETEYEMMRWLEGKLPVPHIIAHEKTNKLSFLLMRKCEGEMACSKYWLGQPQKLCRCLAEALQAFWSVDTTDCPSNCTLNDKLLQAEYNVANGLVDTENTQPDTYGDCGFKDPEALLYWLKENAPEEELVLSHGDFCLPNFLLKDDSLTGVIDLGRAGVADKWCDIALCYRSLKDNYNGRYDNIKKQGFSKSCLFESLGLKPDWDKIRYYILLDELF